MEAPPSIKIGLPGGPTVFYPSAHLAKRDGHTAGEDLFLYLYGDDTVPDHENPLLPATFARTTDGNFPYVPVADLKDGKPTSDYQKRVAKLRDNYPEKVVAVYQRGYGVTTAKSKRNLIATSSIALCVGVLIYEPISKTAAFTHVDKDQDFDSLSDIFHHDAFHSKDLQIHFYGGSILGNMLAISRNTTTRLLNAVFDYASSPYGRDRLTICAFDVMKQPHNSEFTFDLTTGEKYCNFWPMVNTFKGYPLDSKFRFWPDGPNGRYFAAETDSQMAITATELPVDKKALKDYEAKIRCQWDGTPSGNDAFLSEVNRLICKLVIQNAKPLGGIPGIDETTKPGKDTVEAMIQYMCNKYQPMAFEQGLKTWRTKWADAAGVGEDPTKKPGIPIEAVSSVVGVISLVFQENLAVDAMMKQFQKVVDKWAKDNKLDIEGKI
jgi:hypothetical protein